MRVKLSPLGEVNPAPLRGDLSPGRGRRSARTLFLLYHRPDACYTQSCGVMAAAVISLGGCTMRDSRCAAMLLTGLLLLTGALSAAAADPSIVTPIGSFQNSVAAAGGEESLPWDGSRARDEYACTAAFAASELQHYLCRCTARWTSFPVVADAAVPAGDLILLGGPGDNAAVRQLVSEGVLDASGVDSLGPEDYIIRSVSQETRAILWIAGGGRVGTLYGAYDYLYRLGCRWFAPGTLHEEVPAWQRVPLTGWNVREHPAFAIRGFYVWQNRGNEQFFLWMARNRLNLWAAEEDHHPFLRKLGMQLTWGGHNVGYQFLLPDAPYPYDHSQFAEKSPLPPDPYPVSPQFQGDSDRNGVLSYVEAHPEWYGMLDGKRSRRLGNGGVNYCTSNPYATTELVKNAVVELSDGEARDADLFNCWTVDVGRWCECDTCRALGTPTDRYLRFVQSFDQGIKRAQAEGRIRRPVRLMFLIYADVLQPPTRSLPEGFDYDTCIGTYFPIKRCYVHTLDDPACPLNAGFLAALNGWVEAPDRYYRGRVCIGEYYNVSRYRCLPICFMHVMAHDVPYYYQHADARTFHYMHVTTDYWGNKALTNYQLARQLWDVDTDAPALWDDYFQRRYGPAEGEMRAFYASLESMLSNCTMLAYNLRDRLNRNDRQLFPDPHFAYSPEQRSTTGAALGPSLLEMLGSAEQCRQALDRALARRLPPQIEGRIQEDQRGFEYGERTLRLYEALARGLMAGRHGDHEAARQAYREARAWADLLASDHVSATLAHGGADQDAFSASSLQVALRRLKLQVEKTR